MVLTIDQLQNLLPFYFWQDFPRTFVKCVQIFGANDPMSFVLPMQNWPLLGRQSLHLLDIIAFVVFC